MDRDETTTQILNGMQDVLKGQWDSMDADVKESIRTCASFAAKLAVKEAAGDVEYVKKNAPHVESMLADVAGTVLVGMAKKAIGLP
jgi:hypothetical protein